MVKWFTCPREWSLVPELTGQSINSFQLVDMTLSACVPLSCVDDNALCCDIVRVTMDHSGRSWVSDVNHPHYIAGRRAVKEGC